MMSHTNGDDTPPLTLERLREVVRKARQIRWQYEVIAWIDTLDHIPYAASEFMTPDKAIWMKETKYYHAYIVFPSETAAQEMSQVTGKPLVHVRDLPPKEWWKEHIDV